MAAEHHYGVEGFQIRTSKLPVDDQGTMIDGKTLVFIVGDDFHMFPLTLESCRELAVAVLRDMSPELINQACAAAQLPRKPQVVMPSAQQTRDIIRK